MADMLQQLIDEQAIRTITAVYSDAVMRLDAQAAASVYVENGSVVIEGHELTGRDAIAAGMRHSFAEFAILQLNAHGGLITVAGDTAQARWQTTELTIRKHAQQLNVIFGSYQDSLVRVPDGWRFARRVFTMAGRTRLEVTKLQLNPLFAGLAMPEPPAD